MGFFITVLVGFILGILFDRFIASDEIDAIMQMIIPTEKTEEGYDYKECRNCHKIYNLNTLKTESYLDPSTRQSYSRCPNCGQKIRLGILK